MRKSPNGPWRHRQSILFEFPSERGSYYRHRRVLPRSEADRAAFTAAVRKDPDSSKYHQRSKRIYLVFESDLFHTMAFGSSPELLTVLRNPEAGPNRWPRLRWEPNRGWFRIAKIRGCGSFRSFIDADSHC